MQTERLPQDVAPAATAQVLVPGERRVTDLYASFVLSCECGEELFAVMSDDPDQALRCDCGRDWDIRISAQAKARLRS